MKQIFQFFFCLCLCAATTATAQNNPGFMGSKNRISAGVVLYPSVLFSDYSATGYASRFAIERSITRNGSVELSYESYQNQFNDQFYKDNDIASNAGAFRYKLTPNNTVNQFMQGSGTVKSSRIAISKLWYLKKLGSLAPTGVYFGLNLCRNHWVHENTNYSGYYYNMGDPHYLYYNTKPENVTAWFFHIVFGNHISISRHINLGWELKSGRLFGSSVNLQQDYVYDPNLHINQMTRYLFNGQAVFSAGFNLGYYF